MSKYQLAILKNETKDEHLDWIRACENYSDIVDYTVIDLVAENWLEKVKEKKYDFFLTRPPGRIAYYKQLYDERTYIISQILKLPVYPSFKELMIYENKRLLSYFLEAKNIPHPKTWIFYNKDEAIEFIKNYKLPVVAKTNIGAGGSGVKILKNKKDAYQYIERAFTKKGITRSFLPNIRKGDFIKRLKKRLGNLKETTDHFRDKKWAATIDPQKWFVIFQEFIQTDYEWRCVVINDSYFGHKKLRSYGEKISGTSNVSWDIPDENLLNFLKGIVEENNLWSQAIDLFYNKDRGYLVNELQCFWGSKNPHQMIKDGNPGRFLFRDGQWLFEEGSFNKNNSYDLRLKHVLKILENRNQ